MSFFLGKNVIIHIVIVMHELHTFMHYFAFKTFCHSCIVYIYKVVLARLQKKISGLTLTTN